MYTVVVLLTVLLGLCSSHPPEVIGYWENWVDVSWWENNVPGNCLMGCVVPSAYMTKVATYSSVNYGFTFLTQQPAPNQISCQNSSQQCPIWDGQGIYVAEAGMTGATVVNADTTIHTIEQSPGLIAISEMCRLSRQGPGAPKRCLITLGGWSDWARLDSVANAEKLATLIGKMVLLSFADGIDLDFEHLTEFSWLSPNEVDAFISLLENIRLELNKITPDLWKATAQARHDDLVTEYNALPNWQKAESYYYPTNIKYMLDLIANGPPYFEISYTTRFNAIINESNPFNYLLPTSPIPPTFATRNEGKKIWDNAGNVIDNINIMAYDAGSPAGALKFNFETILNNFQVFGPVPAQKLVIGFEPGDQYAGGVWEGLETDVNTIKYVSTNGYGGAMIWAVNPESTNSANWCPQVAQNAFQILDPSYPYGKTPVYTKCDPSTGWISSTN
eukprot:TRINITY_DN10568_c0_g1_i1.p1 TRINITY_DN10568_c0_g1~~TRINITY_DN10568_c0_g1_i1.p1  ORF type:complete len:446 (-),score=92.15 TRINITY_DN10568_c0_g1_i1:88-1425(-)